MSSFTESNTVERMIQDVANARSGLSGGVHVQTRGTEVNA
jgi:hypothetical protein